MLRLIEYIILGYLTGAFYHSLIPEAKSKELFLIGTTWPLFITWLLAFYIKRIFKWLIKQ